MTMKEYEDGVEVLHPVAEETWGSFTVPDPVEGENTYALPVTGEAAHAFLMQYMKVSVEREAHLMGRKVDVVATVAATTMIDENGDAGVGNFIRSVDGTITHLATMLEGLKMAQQVLLQHAQEVLVKRVMAGEKPSAVIRDMGMDL